MLAFVSVALAAVISLAAIAALLTRSDASELTFKRNDAIDRAVDYTLGEIWTPTHSWRTAALKPYLDLASRAGGALQVRDSGGHPVGASPDFGTLTRAGEESGPVLVGGQKVGEVTVRYPDNGAAAVDTALLPGVLQAMAIAAGAAILLALLVAVGLSHRVTSPVRRLADTARARGRGERHARVGHVRAPEEFRDLAAAFDNMAEALGRQETEHRNLIADISHELSTPAAVLVASSEAMLDRVVEPTAEQLTSLHDEALRLSVMVDDLQRLSSAEAARFDLSLAPSDLAEVAARAADVLGDSFDQAGVRLIRQLASVEVMGNAGRLYEVIENLLTNARKYTEAGGSVLIEVGPRAGQALLRVRDTGVGIPHDEQPRIFDRFFRGRQATGTAAGTGIGMTIVADLVQAHAGEVEVSSDPGKGTQITITFPAIPK